MNLKTYLMSASATQTGVHLRAVDERRFKDVLFFVLATNLVRTPCPQAALTALFNSQKWLFFKVL